MQLNSKLSIPTYKLVFALFLALLLWFSTSLKADTSELQAQCQQPNQITALNFALDKGVTQIPLKCELQQNTVLHFTSQVITNANVVAQSGVDVVQIRSTDYAFFIPAGTSQFTLSIESELPFTTTAKLTEEAHYNVVKLQHSAVMFAFFGFCIALVFYVLVIGHGLRSNSFYHYSIYILTTALFFAVQERIFSVFFDASPLIQHYYAASALAGLSVYTGQLFITSLLEFYRNIPRGLYQAIKWLARAVLVLSLLPAVASEQFAFTVQYALGYTTLGVMISMFFGILIAVKKQVHCARLVLISSFVMIFAMMFRIVFADVSEFLTRYALIFAVMVDAFVLSVAVSQKVKKLYIEKLNAIDKANRDPLCGIYNKRGWYQEAQELVHKYNVKGGAIALLYIDVDKFKSINDGYSHEVGDKALQHLTKVLEHQISQQDVLGRVGGDEFVVMAKFKNRALASTFAERISKQLTTMALDHKGEFIEFSASVGFEITTDPIDRLEDVVSHSDKKMYQVKAQCKTN